MAKKQKNELIYFWRYKDYALEAVPARLARFTADEPNETIDFVKYLDSDSTALKYSIGYFWYDEHENEWELKFVGDRFMDIVPNDLVAVWEGLKAAHSILTEWKKQQQNENI